MPKFPLFSFLRTKKKHLGWVILAVIIIGVFVLIGIFNKPSVNDSPNVANSTPFDVTSLPPNTSPASVAALAGTPQSTPVSTTLPVTGPNPSQIKAISGTPQNVIIGKTPANPLQVLVQDSSGNGVAGVVVTFTAPSPQSKNIGATGSVTTTRQVPVATPGGTFAGNVLTATATTNVSGTVNAPTFRANGISGSYVVTASVAGVPTPALFNLTNLDVPSAPADLKATAANAQVSLSWSAPVYSGNGVITGYNIYRLDKNNQPVKLNSVPLTTTTYTDSNLTNNVEYLYMVTALNTVGESGMSLWARAIPRSGALVPNAPALIAGVGSSQQITLYWQPTLNPVNPVVSDTTSFKLYRVDSLNNQSLLATLPVSQTTYVDKGLTNGTLYTYTITALNNVGESAHSNLLSSSPKATSVLPNAPNLVSATGGHSSVVLSWAAPTSSNPAITGYKVYRLNEKGGMITLTATPLPASATTYTDDSNLLPDTVYRYAVTALNSDGESLFSDVRSAKTLPGSS